MLQTNSGIKFNLVRDEDFPETTVNIDTEIPLIYNYNHWTIFWVYDVNCIKTSKELKFWWLNSKEDKQGSD